MKLRTGFVSNSSSSSFVCEICGREYDVDEDSYYSSSDFDMCNCTMSHTFHIECYKKVEDYLNKTKLKSPEISFESIMENVPREHCPICNLDFVTTLDRYSFEKEFKNRKLGNLSSLDSHEKVDSLIRDLFSDQIELQDFTCGNVIIVKEQI